MKTSMHFKVVVTSLAAAVALGGAPVLAQTPTLGELAKKEEARRKGVSAPAKVLTNNDVPKAAPATAKPADDRTAKPADDKAAKPGDDKTAKAAGGGGEGKDEAWWRERITSVRDDLRRNEMFVDAMQTKINSLTADFAARDDPYQRAKIGEERTRAIAEMDRARAEIEQQKKKITDIEEEARRAGVPPGWLR